MNDKIFLPLTDCPNCGTKNIPLRFDECRMSYDIVINSSPENADSLVVSCPNCEYPLPGPLMLKREYVKLGKKKKLTKIQIVLRNIRRLLKV